MFMDDSKSKTFRPKKAHKNGTKRFDLHNKTYATLGSGDVRAAVMLPPGEDINEWLAMNTVDFFNEISLLYGTLVPFCTSESCPIMSAGPKYEYHWADGSTYKTPIKVPAPDYIDFMMTWVEHQLNNEDIFPASVDKPFPSDFKKHIQKIFQRMFRVHAHIYYNHFKKITELGAEAHLNSCFKHFIFFVLEFALVNESEMAPLAELIENLRQRDADKKAQAGTSDLSPKSTDSVLSNGSLPLTSQPSNGEVKKETSSTSPSLTTTSSPVATKDIAIEVLKPKEESKKVEPSKDSSVKKEEACCIML